MTFIPSVEQQAIFDAVINTSDNLAIAALAGTGKTTTLIELSRHLPVNESKIFCAFNKAIVDELERRLPNDVKTSTFHSLGNAAYKRYVGIPGAKPDTSKYRSIVKEWEKQHNSLHDLVNAMAEQQKTQRATQFYTDMLNEVRNFTYDVLNWLRYKLVNWYDTPALVSMIKRAGLDEDILSDPDIIALVIRDIPMLMSLAESMARNGEIDFTDMIYWPVYWNVPVEQFTNVMVDEAQDLSPMQRELVDMALAPGGRIFVVGDKHQAIYAFAGSDADSFDLSVEKWKTKVLPLTVTRRCSSTVTSHAAQIVPEFTCPPMTEPGSVLWIDESGLVGAVKPGDMVICRMRAPLVDAVLDLIGANIPSTILGSDIGKKLAGIVDKLVKRRDWDFEIFPQILQQYQSEQIEYSMSKGNEDKADRVKDECAALLTIFQRAKPKSETGLKYAIEELFSDQKNNGRLVLLSTVHKVKGMEADRVFILKPDKLGTLRGGADNQELNLDYVARTRAKTSLIYLTNRKYLQAVTKPQYVTVEKEVVKSTPIPLPAPQQMVLEVQMSRKAVAIALLDTLSDEELETLIELLDERKAEHA